jgi:hypothetical protein
MRTVAYIVWRVAVYAAIALGWLGEALLSLILVLILIGCGPVGWGILLFWVFADDHATKIRKMEREIENLRKQT